MKFFKLIKPLKIGKSEIKNRFIIPAMHLNATEDGFVNERIIEFYRRRAEGEFGMIIVGGIGVSKRAMGVPMMISISDDKYIEGLQRLTNAVHAAGSKICAQLYHAGAYAFQKLIGQEAVSSSAIPSKFTHETPRELSTSEVEEVIDIISSAALRAKQSGFDAVELLSSAGYLIDQFLSPLKNKRTDRFGGETLEERLTFPIELIKKVRSVVGAEFILGIRLSGDDFVKGSNTFVEKKIIAQAYEKAGVDYINVTGGWHETRVPQIPMNTPVAAFSYLAKEIRGCVSVPVFCSNRINDPEVGEQLIQDFYADAICFGRASIADPDLPKKVREGNLKSLRHCIGCNQGCFDAIFNLKTLSCTVNPLALNEYRYKEISTVNKKQKVVVVGGGPAGMEAALRSHLLGHDVVLLEKSDRLGGQLNVAWVPPGRKDIRYMIEYYEQKFQEMNLNYELNVDATPERVMQENPDIIFCATGVKFNIPNIKGIDGSQGSNICFADTALAGEYLIGKNVVVVGAAATGVETAIWAAEKGSMPPDVAKFLAFYGDLTNISSDELFERTFKGERKVRLIEYLPKVGNSIGKSTKWVMIDELTKLGVDVTVNADIIEFKEKTVLFTRRDDDTGKIHEINGIDTFILATGVKSNRDFSQSLKKFLKVNTDKFKKKPSIREIGDCRSVGNALDAVQSGFKASIRLKRFMP